MATLANLVIKITGDSKKFVADLENAQGRASKFATRLQRTLKPAAIGAGLAIAGIGIASIKMAADTEKGLREVQTLLPQLSEQGFNKLRDDLFAFSSELGIATNQAVPALYQAISAGVPRENVFEFLEVAGKVSIGGVTDLTSAVDVLTSATNAYGDRAGSAAEIADALFTAVRLGKTTIAELSSGFSTAGPLAAALNVDLDELLATVTAITLTGTPTAQAFTQIQAALIALQRTTPEMDKALESMGFATGDAALEALGLTGTLTGLREQADLAGVPLIKLTGRAEAMQAILALTGDNQARVNDILGEFQGKAGAATAAYDVMEGSVSRLWKRIKNDVSVAMQRLGTEILPTVQKALQWFSDNLPKIIDVFAQVGGVLLDLLKPIFESAKFVFILVADALGLTGEKAALSAEELIKQATAAAESMRSTERLTDRLSGLERELGLNSDTMAAFTREEGINVALNATHGEALVALAREFTATGTATDSAILGYARARIEVRDLASEYGVSRVEMLGMIDAINRGVPAQDALSNATALGVQMQRDLDEALAATRATTSGLAEAQRVLAASHDEAVAAARRQIDALVGLSAETLALRVMSGELSRGEAFGLARQIGQLRAEIADAAFWFDIIITAEEKAGRTTADLTSAVDDLSKSLGGGGGGGGGGGAAGTAGDFARVLTKDLNPALTALLNQASVVANEAFRRGLMQDLADLMALVDGTVLPGLERMIANFIRQGPTVDQLREFIRDLETAYGDLGDAAEESADRQVSAAERSAAALKKTVAEIVEAQRQQAASAAANQMIDIPGLGTARLIGNMAVLPSGQTIDLLTGESFSGNAETQSLFAFGRTSPGPAQLAGRELEGFAHGGVVPGLRGEPVLAVVPGGEMITPPGPAGGGVSINVTIHVAGDVTAEGLDEHIISTVGDIIRRGGFSELTP